MSQESRDLSARQREYVDAALELLDEVGLENVSLRKLADRLGVRAPSLYWHFANKTALIDHMAEQILDTEFHDLEPGQAEQWRAWVAEVSRRLRRAMLSHRDGGRVVAGAHLHPAITLLRISDAMMDTLIAAGLDAHLARDVVITLVHFTFGRVIEEQSGPDHSSLDPNVLNALAADHPSFSRAVTLSRERSAADDFDHGIALILDGAEARRRNTPTAQDGRRPITP